jgi:hypothetical protein
VRDAARGRRDCKRAKTPLQNGENLVSAENRCCRTPARRLEDARSGREIRGREKTEERNEKDERGGRTRETNEEDERRFPL